MGAGRGVRVDARLVAREVRCERDQCAMNAHCLDPVSSSVLFNLFCFVLCVCFVPCIFCVFLCCWFFLFFLFVFFLLYFYCIFYCSTKKFQTSSNAV